MKVEPWDRFMWEQLVRSADVLTGREVQAGLVLATYADADGSRVRPGMDTVADDCRCSPATSRRAVQGLLAYGLLEVVHRGGGFASRGGAGLATEYRLTIPADDAAWEALQVRKPGERRQRRLTAHQRAESAPVDEATLRSPACEESGPVEATHRSPVTDSPLIPARLSAHPDARGPQDQPRPPDLRPQPAENEPSPEPTRTRERRRGRQPTAAERARAAAENAIRRLTAAGRAGLRDRAVDRLLAIDELPSDWEHDEDHPWEPLIARQMVAVMAADQATERRLQADRHRRGA